MIHVIDFHPIGILTHLAPQNDCQHLNFVKDIYVVGKKMARNGCKMANAYCCDLYTASDYSSYNSYFIRGGSIQTFYRTL